MKLFDHHQHIEVGIDEVGRGCLFGRVYSAAVILPKEIDPDDTFHLEIKDSKKLSKKNRQLLSDYIKYIALDYQITYEDVDTIDKYNILQATYKSMHKSIDNLLIQVDSILVDGNNFKPYMYTNSNNEWNNIPHKCIINGDNEFISIAAASILAKVARDNYIDELCTKHPILDKLYDISSNKGYGTKKHLDGIINNGITNLHRKTFGLCKNYTSNILELIE